MTRQRFLAAFFLAVLLAIGQQVALLHGLGHAVDKVSHSSDPKLPPSSACPDCGLAAQLSGLPGAAAPMVALQPADLVPAIFVAGGIVARATPAFHSRGPPAFS